MINVQVRGTLSMAHSKVLPLLHVETCAMPPAHQYSTVWVTNTCDDLLPAVLLQLSLVCVVVV